MSEQKRPAGNEPFGFLREYHETLRAFVENVQDKAANFGMALMFPSDDAELAARNRKLSEGSIAL